MENRNLAEVYFAEIKRMYQRGQRIIYEGNEAEIIEISPVFTIRIVGKSTVICGNTLYNEIMPYNSHDYWLEDTVEDNPNENRMFEGC
jgi:hypothetical protein